MSYLSATEEVVAVEAAEAAATEADPRGQIEVAKLTKTKTSPKTRIRTEVVDIPSRITREIDVHNRIEVVHGGRAPLASLSQ